MDYFVQSRFHSIRSLLSIFAAQPMGPKEALLSAQADQGSDHIINGFFLRCGTKTVVSPNFKVLHAFLYRPSSPSLVTR